MAQDKDKKLKKIYRQGYINYLTVAITINLVLQLFTISSLIFNISYGNREGYAISLFFCNFIMLWGLIQDE